MTLLRSLSFRLAVLYLAVFAASVATLGGLVYWVEILQPLAEVRDGIETEMEELGEVYRREGPLGLAEALELRVATGGSRAPYHALLDRNGQALTANLPSWPQTFVPGWKRIEADVAREGDEDEYEALVLDRRLPGGERLLIGRDVDDIDELQERVGDTMLWIVPALLILGTLGGALMSRVIGQRIEAISDAALAVIDGDLSSRIALRSANDDFDRLAATLNLMLERLERSMEAVRRVSDSVAHELRTPVTRLQTALSDLRDQPEREGIGEALAEANRLQAAIDAVLRISRIEAGRHEIALQAVSLSSLLADVAEYYQPETEARNQRFETDIPPDLTVKGDPDLLFQAFANLLDNAVKFTPSGGKVALSAVKEEGVVRVDVQDDGPGIPQEFLGRVTERFFRAPGAGGVAGLGLGLSLVAAIAAAHGSRLDFASDDSGFRAIWRLPLVKR